MPLWRKVAVVGGSAMLIPIGLLGVTYRRRLQENKAVTAEVFNAAQNAVVLGQCLEALQRSRVGRKLGVEPPLIELYRYTACPFCGTVKAVLDAYRVPHVCVEVEPMFKKEIAPFAYKKVPQLCLYPPESSSSVAQGTTELTVPRGGKGGASVVDSDAILRRLAPVLGFEKEIKAPDVAQWREWARGPLLRLLVLNLNASLRKSWDAFRYIDKFDSFSFSSKLFLKATGGPVMYLVAKYKTLPALKEEGVIKDPQGGDRWDALLRECEKLGAKVGDGFLGGKTPNIADLDTFGVLQSVRDTAIYEELKGHISMGGWLRRMEAFVESPSSSAHPCRV